MSESCDRIVYHLRREGFNIYLFHLSYSIENFDTQISFNGSTTKVPISSDTEHSLNLLYLFINNFMKGKTISAIVGFGGSLPLLSSPIIAKLLNLKLIIFLRGNDFDISLFSSKKREVLFYALQSSCVSFLNSKEKIQKLRNLLPDVNAIFLPNSIDLESFFISNFDIQESKKIRGELKYKKIIGFFGQLKAKKGVSFFLHSLTENEKNQISFLICGEIGQEIIDYLKLNNFNYHLYSYQNRIDLIKFYISCDAVALPSFYEGMPNVLLEASSLGIPCIGSKIDGIKDFFEDIEDHFLFTPLDPISCRNSVIKFLSTTEGTIQKHKEILIEKIKLKYQPSDEVKIIIDTLKKNGIL